MDSEYCTAFSSEGQFWATCGRDGKLKIWETGSNRLKQEYTPNLHLSSPCNVLQWMKFTSQTTTVTPSKKKKKKAIDDAIHKSYIAMGSSNGKITIYDVAAASVEKLLDNGHSSTVTALAWSPSCGLFSAGDDHKIIQWDVKDSIIVSKWKSDSKITSMAISPDDKMLITAERNIKCWDIERKSVCKTFSGHINPIFFLRTVEFNDDVHYLISGAKGDSYLSVWSLNGTNTTSIGTLSMTIDPVSLSVQVTDSSQITVVATNRSNQINVFKYQPNGSVGKSPKKSMKPLKPLKPLVTVLIMGQTNTKENNKVPQIPVYSSHLIDDDKILAAYGSITSLIFEKITIDWTEKVQILVRTDNKYTKEKKDELIGKIKSVDTESNVEYLTLGNVNNQIKRQKNSSGSQLPLKERLENLSLTTDTNTPGKKPTKHLTQLLIQGLTSKDKSILLTVLFNRDEKIIKNTVAALPIAAIPPLLKELTGMLQGRTFISKIAINWLKNLITMHAAHLLSLPDIADVLSPILGFIDAKLLLLPELSRLRGRVALVTGQISHLNDKNNHNMIEDCLLVYQDPESSDEDTDVEGLQNQSESDDIWEESSDEEMENGKTDDDDDDDDDEDNNRDKHNNDDDDDDDDDNISVCS